MSAKAKLYMYMYRTQVHLDTLARHNSSARARRRNITRCEAIQPKTKVERASPASCGGAGGVVTTEGIRKHGPYARA